MSFNWKYIVEYDWMLCFCEASEMVKFYTANKLKNIIFAWSWTLNIFIFECSEEIYFFFVPLLFFLLKYVCIERNYTYFVTATTKETMIVKNGSDDILSSYWNNEEGAFQVRYSCIQRVEDKLT